MTSKYVLFLFLFAAPIARAEAGRKELNCYLRESVSQGGAVIEEKTWKEPLKVLPAKSFSPGARFAEIKYTTKDGFAQIDAEAVHPAAHLSPPANTVVRDYLPIWITNLKTNEMVSANGAPDPSSLKMPDNNVTSLHAEFPTSVNVTCWMD